MLNLLIRNANVITPEAGRVVYKPGQDILIRDNKIEAVMKTGSVDPSQAQMTVAATGMIALPGLINTHCHTAMVVFRGLAEDVTVDQWFNDYIWPAEANLTPEDVYWCTLLGLGRDDRGGRDDGRGIIISRWMRWRRLSQAGTRGALAWASFSTGVEKS